MAIEEGRGRERRREEEEEEEEEEQRGRAGEYVTSRSHPACRPLN